VAELEARWRSEKRGNVLFWTHVMAAYGPESTEADTVRKQVDWGSCSVVAGRSI